MVDYGSESVKAMTLLLVLAFYIYKIIHHFM